MRTDIKFTFEDYAALPETGPRYQLVEGELIVSPSPSLRHQTILGRIFITLSNHVDAKKLGTVLMAPLDVILSDEDVYHPDILFVDRKRSSTMVAEGVRGAPDLCVEILSPSNRQLDCTTKKKQYARFGVTEYWIVDPEADTVSVFRLQEDSAAPIRVFGRMEILTSNLLPGLALDLNHVFER